jgi:hypothetical protein
MDFQNGLQAQNLKLRKAWYEGGKQRPDDFRYQSESMWRFRKSVRKPASAACKVLLLEKSLLTNPLKKLDAISNSGKVEQVFAESRAD